LQIQKVKETLWQSNQKAANDSVEQHEITATLALSSMHPAGWYVIHLRTSRDARHGSSRASSLRSIGWTDRSEVSQITSTRSAGMFVNV